MVECPFCRAQCDENIIFCSECGGYLQEDDRRGTDSLGFIPEVVEAPLLSRAQAPVAILLTIGEQGRELVLSLEHPVNLGRRDPTDYTVLEVDLTEDGGSRAGVSRRHAKIFKRGASVMIEDVGSRNGTKVNGWPLAPFTPQPLAHGDYLRVGRLILQIFFEDEEGIFEKRPDLSPEARQEDLRRRLAHLFELYEGGLSYLEWLPPESASDSRSVTRLLGEMLPLPRLGATLIGRYSDVGLQLSSRKVSGHHCRLFYADYRFFVEDLGSTNGTFLNKTRLAPYHPQELSHGDTCRVGDISLFFHDRLQAFLSELKSPLERQIVVEGIKARSGQETEAAICFLARALYGWVGRAEGKIVNATLRLIEDLLEDAPLTGLDLLLKVTQPGRGHTNERVYQILSRFLAGQVETLPQGLVLILRLTGEHSLALLHWISRASASGAFKTFLETCEELFFRGDYSQVDLERLIANLDPISEGVAPENRLSLYQTLFEMLNLKSAAEIAAFPLPPFVDEVADPPAAVSDWLRRLSAVSALAQQAVGGVELPDKLSYLSETLNLLNQIKQETTFSSQRPELILHSEILFHWRWIIVSERGRLKRNEGRAKA